MTEQSGQEDLTRINGISSGQLVTWILNLFIGIGLMVGAWYFSGMSNSVEKLRDEVAQLKTQVALLQSTKGEIELLKAQLAAYIGQNSENIKNQAVLSEQLKSLNRRVDELERRNTRRRLGEPESPR